jgi:putative ATPase
LGYGEGYRYAHNEQDAVAKGQTYFPEALGEQNYYAPTQRGLEIKISEKLKQLRGS